jgi:hypothetical protein
MTGFSGGPSQKLDMIVPFQTGSMMSDNPIYRELATPPIRFRDTYQLSSLQSGSA